MSATPTVPPQPAPFAPSAPSMPVPATTDAADRSDPPLAPAPTAGPFARNAATIRRWFLVLNRRLILPAHHAGLAAWMGSPIGGYILVLRTHGRRSGAVREAPLSYLVAEGSVWVLAGLGTRTQWYRNVLADPEVDVLLPGRRLHGRATEVRATEVRAHILPRLLRATGVPAILSGINPWQASDGEILKALDFVPLVRIDAAAGPLDPGPDDPGGRAWIWRQGLLAALTWLAVGRRGRGRWRARTRR